MHRILRTIGVALTISFAPTLLACSSDNDTPTSGKPTGDQAEIIAPTPVDVFPHGYNGSEYYRIPAIVATNDGTLVAVADNRHDNNGDLGLATISVVCRTSNDMGQTWSEGFNVIKEGSSIADSYGDAALAYDPETNTLLTIFSGNMGFWQGTHDSHAGFYCSRSVDNGATWSEPEEFSAQLYAQQPDWAGAFCASGAMLRIANGPYKGRIMFVANVHITGGQWSEAGCREYVCYTDDLGKTWHTTSTTPVPAQFRDQFWGNESKLVECADGSLLMSIRNASGRRMLSRSTDGGTTWGKIWRPEPLVEPSCNGDIISAVDSKGRNVLLHSLCNDAHSRVNGTIFLSYDNGKTWPVQRTINPGFTGYTTLCLLPDGTIGCLLEDGTDSGNSWYDLKFYRFNIDWLTEE